MTTEQIGFTQGTVGVIGLTIGGILGGIAVSRHGLKKWLWPMVWAISLPDIVYVYLSFFQHSSLAVINLCIFIEQFGYGFGFTAYMLWRKQNSTLCNMYSIYGIRNDASGNDSRMAAGNHGIPYVLYMDYGMHGCDILGYIIAEN